MLEGYRAQRRLQQLIHDWREYREFVVAARGHEIGPEQEERFRELEAKIATRLRSVSDVVPYVAAEEARREFGAMTDLLKRQRSLRDAASAQESDPDGFDRFWHEHYIFLNQLKGVPLGRQDDGRPGAPRRAAAVPGGTERRWRRLNSFPAKRIGRLLSIVIFLAVIIYVTVFGLGLRYDSPSGRFIADSQLGVAKVVQNVMNWILDVWLDVVKFFDPVIIRYGPLWTSVLFILLALTVGYWMFVRG